MRLAGRASGDIVASDVLTLSTAFSGRARAAFLDVPEGSCSLHVVAELADVVVSANGVTLVRR